MENVSVPSVPATAEMNNRVTDHSGARDDVHLMALWLQAQRSDHTRRAYRRDLGQFLAAAGSPRLRAITVADLQAWQASLRGGQYAPATVNRKLAAVRSLLSFAHKTGYLPFNVGGVLNAVPSPNRLAERILSERDTLNLLHAAGGQRQATRNRALLLTLYYTGARIAELCALQWRDVTNLQGPTPALTLQGKGGITRHVALPMQAAQSLAVLHREARRRIGPEDYVFGTVTGRPLRPQSAHVILRAAARRAGLPQPISPHWLRHAHATHALDRGALPHVVQATLGHASLATTSRYVHVRPTHSSGHALAAVQAVDAEPSGDRVNG